MAFQIEGQNLSLEAAADLSTHQYKFVVVDANGKAALAGDNGNAIGVLQNKPTSGQAATIQYSGVTKFVGSGSLAPATKIGSDANAKGKAAVAATEVIGTVLVNPGADGQIGSLLLQFAGKEA